MEVFGFCIGLQDSILDDRYPVGQGHGLDLVVGYVDTGYPQIPLQRFYLTSHGDPKACVQVGEGFVKEEQPGFFDQRPAQGDPLLLSPGKLYRFPVKKLTDPHHIGHPLGLSLHLLLGPFF